MISDELKKAYQQTGYVVGVPGAREITLRIGERSRDLDQLLLARGESHWAFVTAHNPRSTPLPDAENEARHQELRRRTRELNYETLPGRGQGDDATWPAEKSLFIFGITPNAAQELGREFEQNAVVVGARGAAAELLFIEGEHGS